jgi:hypothetical protein
METVCLSEMLVSTYEPARHYNPEEEHRQLYSHVNLKSHNYTCLFNPLNPSGNYMSQMS